MSPSALLEDRAPSCMLYSMVECRAWGSRTHPWPCRAMLGEVGTVHKSTYKQAGDMPAHFRGATRQP